MAVAIAITVTSVLLPYFPNLGRRMTVLSGKNDCFGVGVAILG
jgi:hypothetical protein